MQYIVLWISENWAICTETIKEDWERSLTHICLYRYVRLLRDTQTDTYVDLKKMKTITQLNNLHKNNSRILLVSYSKTFAYQIPQNI